MRHARLNVIIALVAAAALSGCRNDEQVKIAENEMSGSTSANIAAGRKLPSGTSFVVTLVTPITSETANVGDSWIGTTRDASVIDGRSIIPAGSSVGGTITSVKPARKGDRAMLDLGMTSIKIDGRSYRVRGATEAIIAGSTRARNLGAIAGSAAGGALVGKAATGTGKGAVIGGIIGGGVATGVVAASDGFQVMLKEGTPLTFTTSEVLAVRP